MPSDRVLALVAHGAHRQKDHGRRKGGAVHGQGAVDRGVLVTGEDDQGRRIGTREGSGSKATEENCRRCGGEGRLAQHSTVMGGTCFKCGGGGKQWTNTSTIKKREKRELAEVAEREARQAAEAAKSPEQKRAEAAAHDRSIVESMPSELGKKLNAYIEDETVAGDARVREVLGVWNQRKTRKIYDGTPEGEAEWLTKAIGNLPHPDEIWEQRTASAALVEMADTGEMSRAEQWHRQERIRAGRLTRPESFAAAVVAACKSKACAPPPVGKGGSIPKGGGSGGGKPSEIPPGSAPRKEGESLPGTPGATADNPIRTKDMKEAVKALAAGQHVALEQKVEVSTLLDELHAEVQRVVETTGKKPDINLCKVSVPGTNLFCAGNKGINRDLMPQLGGKPVPGSKASKLPMKDGEVDASAQFVDHLKKSGVKTEQKAWDPAELRATQNELVGAKVAGMVDSAKAGKWDPGEKPIFVSKDGYVIDGHHRWAARVGANADGIDKRPMNTITLDLTITEALTAAKDFSKDFGIKPKKAKA